MRTYSIPEYNLIFSYINNIYDIGRDFTDPVTPEHIKEMEHILCILDVMNYKGEFISNDKLIILEIEKYC